MRYRWNGYEFAPDGALLTHQGGHIAISGKVLHCIRYLIEQRSRVVSSDELIECIWGHHDVSNNQLTQIIVSARRAVGDDGQSQTVIRTISGRGYRWVQPLDAVSPPFEPEPAMSRVPTTNTDRLTADTVVDTATDPRLAHVPGPGSRTPFAWRPRTTELVLLALAALATYSQVPGPTGYPATAATRSPEAARVESLKGAGPLPPNIVPDTVDGLREAMRLGKHELVRTGLSRMSPQVLGAPDVRMLQIELDIERGRFDRAERAIALELAKAGAGESSLSWRAHLLTLQSEARADAGLGASQVLPPATAAVKLLESADGSATSPTMGRALSARGNAFLIDNALPAAIADLVRARDILRKAGDPRRAAKAQRYLAHVWLREGRTADALEEIAAAADTLERLEDPVNEISARNMTTRIQAVQLRWDQALAGSERSLRLSTTVSGTPRSLGALNARSYVLTHVGRLREAGYFLEEAKAIGAQESYSFAAIHALASGRFEDALAQAALGFERYGPESRLNMHLESREGALLLWMIAAQALVERGEPMPVPTAMQRAALERPETDIGRIALGRWLWAQGKLDAAEAEMRHGLVSPRETGRLLEYLYANEALIELLLSRGDEEGAQRTLTEMWGRSPDRYARDYRANLLALRVALRAGQRDAVVSAYRQTNALAGERALPIAVVKAYALRAAAPTRSIDPPLASMAESR